MRGKEFNFEKSLKIIKKAIQENGLQEDMVLNTLLTEFIRLKKVCDELYAKIDEVGVCYEEETFKGRKAFKQNPLVNEYVKAHKTLVATGSELEKYIEKLGTTKEEYDL